MKYFEALGEHYFEFDGVEEMTLCGLVEPGETEVSKTCLEAIKAWGGYYGYHTACFDDKSKATLFKLTYGGSNELDRNAQSAMEDDMILEEYDDRMYR